MEMKTDEQTGFDFTARLDESARIHGHLCPGQVLGIKMSMLGLRKAGIRNPKGKDRKSIISCHKW